jgi:AcrR family transcriptional regulator
MADGVQQLPRGRHGLPREQVFASQHGRMLEGIAAAVADKGYAQTTVADVIARAGVSRETFYEQFGGKEDAFLAALDAGADGLVWILRSAAEAGDDVAPLQRLDHLLEAYLSTLASAPDFAKAFLIDAYGAGTEATSRRIGLQQRFVELIAGVLELDPGNPDDAFSCEVLVAAVSSLATSRIGTGREAELTELREPLIALARRLALGVAA